jgi:hypothetical protein
MPAFNPPPPPPRTHLGLQPDYHFVSTRTISPNNAEGTPNVLAVEGTSVLNSRISIGLHYYKDGSIDLQAVAVLKNFELWTVMPSTISNEWMMTNGYRGKVRGRQIFTWNGQELWTVEVLLCAHWSLCCTYIPSVLIGSKKCR